MPDQAPRLLAVEDESDILDLLIMSFSSEGFEVQGAEDGLSGLEKCLAFRPDIVIMDLMLPRLDGLALCRRLRGDGRFRMLPIIMLTAKAEEADRLAGFESGADDYVVKPFSFKELVLRAKALLRRSRGISGELPVSAQGDKNVLCFGDLEINHKAHRVTYKGREIVLTALEYKLLHNLARNCGAVMERGRLLEEVWGYNEDSGARTVDTHMRRLRQKMGEADFFLETIRGVGYRFKS